MNVPGQMSGQPVQMNLGGGGEGLQQHQPLQVASRHLDMDPQFLKLRSVMHRNM
jgi:E1A/CREB-binding protein